MTYKFIILYVFQLNEDNYYYSKTLTIETMSDQGTKCVGLFDSFKFQ